jgi:hypothetical protein
VSGSTTSRRGSAVDLPTLVVTALASAVAAYVTSKIWAAGTLAAAAFTPVLVALLKEAFAKPVEVVTRAVPVRGVVRSSGGPEDHELPAAGSISREAGDVGDTPEAIEARIAQLGEAPGSSRPGRRRAWQVAVVTGLLGFLVAAVIITVPELIAGGSVSGGGRDTTLFSTKHSSGGSAGTTTQTTTATTPSDTETTPLDETITIPDAKTVTVPPPAVTVPDAQTPVAPQANPTLTDTVPAEPPPP